MYMSIDMYINYIIALCLVKPKLALIASQEMSPEKNQGIVDSQLVLPRMEVRGKEDRLWVCNRNGNMWRLFCDIGGHPAR